VDVTGKKKKNFKEYIGKGISNAFGTAVRNSPSALQMIKTHIVAKTTSTSGGSGGRFHVACKCPGCGTPARKDNIEEVMQYGSAHLARVQFRSLLEHCGVVVDSAELDAFLAENANKPIWCAVVKMTRDIADWSTSDVDDNEFVNAVKEHVEVSRSRSAATFARVVAGIEMMQQQQFENATPDDDDDVCEEDDDSGDDDDDSKEDDDSDDDDEVDDEAGVVPAVDEQRMRLAAAVVAAKMQADAGAHVAEAVAQADEAVADQAEAVAQADEAGAQAVEAVAQADEAGAQAVEAVAQADEAGAQAVEADVAQQIEDIIRKQIAKQNAKLKAAEEQLRIELAAAQEALQGAQYEKAQCKSEADRLVEGLKSFNAQKVQEIKALQEVQDEKVLELATAQQELATARQELAAAQQELNALRDEKVLQQLTAMKPSMEAAMTAMMTTMRIDLWEKMKEGVDAAEAAVQLTQLHGDNNNKNKRKRGSPKSAEQED